NLSQPKKNHEDTTNYRPDSVPAPLYVIQGSLRKTDQGELSSILPDQTTSLVPAILFDGGNVDATMEEHDDVIDWCKQVMGMNIAQHENWTPGPEAAVGKMTHMGWGVWIQSGKTKEGISAPPAKREIADSNIYWYWN